jgi:serine/threonine-protein kinase
MIDTDESKYKYLFRIGQGGMADVYLAALQGPAGISKLVVIKQLLEKMSGKKVFRQMFLDEARLATRFNHPNVVQTYEVFERGKDLLLAMEYLEGQPLNRVLREMSRRDAKVSSALLARVASDALAGLHHAHELTDFDGGKLSVIHRDVSPQNIFVTYDGQVKVVDFGIAKTADSTSKTQTGVLKGKAAYMAPEQLNGDPIDRRVDVFTAGTVLWELLTMRRLMAGSSHMETLLRVMREPIPRVSEFVPHVDLRLDRIVARALERDPARRFPTALAMREALEDYIAASGLPSRHEDIGRLVNELFKETRASVQGQIRERLREEASASESRIQTPRLLTLVDQTVAATPRAIRRVPPKVTVKGRARVAGRVLVATLGILASVVYVRHVASNQSLAPRALESDAEQQITLPNPEAPMEPPSTAPTVANEAPSAAPSTRSEGTATPVSAPSLGAARRSVSLEHHRRRPTR